MPMLSAARQRESISGLVAVTEGTPLHAPGPPHTSPTPAPYQPHPANRDVSTGLRVAKSLPCHVEQGACVNAALAPACPHLTGKAQ
eukprot:313426-Chlamydomonas_euryale.AAC.1